MIFQGVLCKYAYGASPNVLTHISTALTMSQATLLEKVVNWSPVICQQQLKVVLPKLVIPFIVALIVGLNTSVLQIIVDMFLPHLSLSELEECFSKILPKVVMMFTALLEEIGKQIGDLSSQNKELHAFLRNILQVMVKTLEALSACVHHVCALNETISFYSIRSLPSCVLLILKGSFQHCKDSEVVYSGRLSLVGDLLQGLFREAYSLQKGLTDLLDKISLEKTASEEEISDIVTVIHSLLEICSVISNLDIALHANMWKLIIKQIVKYHSLVEERLRHSDFITFLCEDLLTSVRNSLEMAEQMQQSDLKEVMQCPEYKLFQKAIKMCSFFANTLVHYIKIFSPFLSKFCSHLHQLYLQVLSKLPPSALVPTVPAGLVEELSRVVLIPMDAMLMQLLPMRSFVQCVLTPDQKYSSAALVLPQCLLLVNVLGKLCAQTDEALCLWYDGSQFSEETHRLSIFEAVFLSFRQCLVERTVPVRLPGVMIHGQAQGIVSLHQHVCVHLCGCVATLPAQHFTRLEHSLLGAVLQSDIQTAVLATDVWCFLARYGTAELCLQHVLLTAHLIKSCPCDCYKLTHLALLLRRLLFLMTPNHQLAFVECFLPSKDENLCVWSPVLLSSLCSAVRARVEREVISSTQAALDDWHGAGYKLGSIPNLNKALSCLLVVVREPLLAECTTAPLNIIHRLWNRMSAAQVQTHSSLHSTLRLLLSISAKLIKRIEPQAIVQGVSCLIGLKLQNCGDDLVLAALEYLASMGKVFVPPDIQFEVLPRLSGLFSTLLNHESWLLRQYTMEAFATFAEATSHEEVISQSLTTEETKNKVVNFLSKVITQQTAGVPIERLRAEACVIERHNDTLESRQTTPEQTSVAEPCPKRPHQESCRQEEYEHYFQAAECALRALQGIWGEAPLWVTSRLQALQTLITQMISNNPH